VLVLGAIQARKQTKSATRWQDAPRHHPPPRAQVLPAVVNFDPDLIIVSAGFDAHRKDEINFQFVGVREHDFAWVTDQIVQARSVLNVGCLSVCLACGIAFTWVTIQTVLVLAHPSWML
jgi:acetoin utilization deacetylase AcuC-like enzyme